MSIDTLRREKQHPFSPINFFNDLYFNTLWIGDNFSRKSQSKLSLRLARATLHAETPLVVALRPEQKSLPSGPLQDWPDARHSP